MALTAIRTNKLRSALTLLGIAVGVFSIIGVMTAMGVLQNSIESGMSALGSTTFQIQKYPMFQDGDPSDQANLRNRRDLTFEQGSRLKERASLASAVGMFAAAQQGMVVASQRGEKTNPNVTLTGRDIEGFTANNWTIGEGRFYTSEELAAGKHVAVLGKDVVEKLFPKSNPLGQIVRIDGREYEVLGTVVTNGSMLGGSNDNMVIIPITTFFNVYGHNRPIAIKVVAPSTDALADCIEQVRGALRTIRQVAPGEDDDFYIWTNDSLITQFNEFTKYFRLGVLLVSAISLLAAGVGIMNIMLVSVTERTREIGIRKAVGAKRTNILSQFVLEAVVISEIGGVIGILLGILAGNLVAFLLEIPPVIPVQWVAIGFVSCSLVGIIFGVYPAWKASNLDPIDSLRYE